MSQQHQPLLLLHQIRQLKEIDMTKYWWCCTKCDDVHPYQIIDDWNDFPRGEFMVHQEFITTGFKSEQDARAYLDEKKGRPPVTWHHYLVEYKFAHRSSRGHDSALRTPH